MKLKTIGASCHVKSRHIVSRRGMSRHVNHDMLRVRHSKCRTCVVFLCNTSSEQTGSSLRYEKCPTFIGPVRLSTVPWSRGGDLWGSRGGPFNILGGWDGDVYVPQNFVNIL